MIFAFGLGAWSVFLFLPDMCALDILSLRHNNEAHPPPVSALHHGPKLAPARVKDDVLSKIPALSRKGGDNGGDKQQGQQQRQRQEQSQQPQRQQAAQQGAKAGEAAFAHHKAHEDRPIESGMEHTDVMVRADPFEKILSAKGKADVTVLITVECLEYHDWQSVAVIYSLKRLMAVHADQNYDVWRLVSCDKPESKTMRSMANYIRSPQMSPHPKTGYHFPTLNKPMALLSWMNGPGRTYADNHEFIITDPDFLFIAPLPLGVSRLGRPVAGHYHMGGAWLKEHDVVKHCRGKCDALIDNTLELEQHWVVGPPYFIRAGDFRKIYAHWFNITEHMVFDADPKKAWGAPGGWLADMYAYIMGARLEGVVHDIRDDFFVSSEREFEWTTMLRRDAHAKFISIHLCQNYDLSTVRFANNASYSMQFNKHDWHERKRDGPLTLLNCSRATQQRMFRNKGWNPHPDILAADEPDAALHIRHPNTPALRDEAKAKRAVFMLWWMRKIFDEAFTWYRYMYCSDIDDTDKNFNWPGV